MGLLSIVQGRNVRPFLIFSVAVSSWSAHGATIWDNDAGTAQWSSGVNWSGGLEPTAADDVLLPSVIPANGSTISLGTGEVANSINFAGYYTLNGGDLTLTSGVIRVSGGGDATINSLLVGGNGLTKTGEGMLTLSSTTGYTGPTTISAGTLQSTATSGSVGTGNLLLNRQLTLSPATVSASTDISLTSATATASSAVTFGAGAKLELAKNGNRSLTFTIGNAGAAPFSALLQGGSGTLTIRNQSGIGNLGSATGERLLVRGGVPMANGMVSPAIQSSEGDFLTYSPTNGFARAPYSSSTNLNGGSAGDLRIFDVKTPQTLTADSQVYALRVAEQITANGFSVTVGSGGVAVVGDQTLPTIDFGSNSGFLNVAGFAFITSLRGSGGVTVFGDGHTVLSFANLSGLTGGVRLVGGVVNFANAQAFGGNTITLGGARLYQASFSSTFPNDIVLEGGGTIGMPYGPFNFTGQISGGPAPGSGVRALTLEGNASASNGSVPIYSFGTSPKTFTGDLAIRGAILAVPAQGTADPTILGSGTKSIILESGGVFQAIANGSVVTHNPPSATKSIQVGNSGGTMSVDNGVTVTLDDPEQLTGSGVLTKTGPGTLVLGSPSSGQTAFTGSVNLSQGILRVRHPEALGSSATANVDISGGTLELVNNGAGSDMPINFGFDVSVSAPSTINVGRETENTGNTIHLDSLSVGTATLVTTGTNGYGLAFDGTTTLTGNATFKPYVPFTLAGTITENASGGRLTLDPGNSTSKLTLGGVANHTGGTFIRSATLALAPAGNISRGDIDISSGAVFDVSAVTGGFTFGAGRTLSNFGRVVGALNVGGTLTSYSTIDGAVKITQGGTAFFSSSTVNGPVTVEDGGTFFLSFGVTTMQDFVLLAGGDFKFVLGGGSRADVSGEISLAGELLGTTSIRPAVGTTFYLLRNDGSDPVKGTFDGLPEGSTVSFSGLEFAITYKANGDGGTVGNDVALVTTVPEPSSFALGIATSACLLGVRRFRRGRGRSDYLLTLRN